MSAELWQKQEFLLAEKGNNAVHNSFVILNSRLDSSC